MTAIDALPDYRARSNFLYALEFGDGVVKIGYSFKPRSRARQLQKSYGAPVVRCAAFQHPGETLHLAERAALKDAAALVGCPNYRGEYFHGLGFERAEELIRAAAGGTHKLRQGPHFSQTKEGRRAAALRRQRRDETHSAMVFGRLLEALATCKPVKAA